MNQINHVTQFFLLRLKKIKLLGHFVADEQQQIYLQGGNERTQDIEERSNYGGACPGGRICVPMSECTAMYYEVAKSCYNGDRSMYCGGTQYEPYICCPKSPLEQNSVCGKTLVSGQFYRGLGAFPFVARIGFKSKCEKWKFHVKFSHYSRTICHRKQLVS